MAQRRAEMTQLLKQDPYGAATCRFPRKTPQPGASVKGAVWLLEALVVGYSIFAMIVGFLEISDSWSQSGERWKWYMLTATLVWGIWWLLTTFALVTSGLNESYVSRMGNTKSSTVDTLPHYNLPSVRFGWVYVSLMTAGVAVATSYHWILMNDFGPDITMTEGNRRVFHLYVKILTLVLFLHTLVEVIDWFELIHVGLTQDDRKEVCHDLHCTQAGAQGNKEHDEAYAKVAPYAALSHLISVAVLVACIVGIAFLLEQLRYGFNSFWSMSAWRLFTGIMAIFFGVIMLFTLLSAFATDHKCVRRSAYHGMWYWMALFWWMGTIWYFMHQFILDGREAKFATDILQQRVFENYLFDVLLLLASHVYYSLYHGFKCQINYELRVAMCPNFEGF